MMTPTRTHKMAYVAILSAVSFLLMYFQVQILPGVDFLKLDFSILPMLLALLMIGEKSAYTILIIRSILQLMINNQGASSVIGIPMNMVAYALFIFSLARWWKNRSSIMQYVLASGLGTVLLTGAMLLLNLVYALPLYARFAHFELSAFGITVEDYLWTMVLPFNFLQGLIFSLVFYLVYRSLGPILRISFGVKR